MSRIFLSHSSIDEKEALALKQWLTNNGWGEEDVFLDIDPIRGLAAGERWQLALRRAADRCEAAVFIVSPAWTQSKWCLAEFLLAKSLNKLIFGVLLKEVAFEDLPNEMTSEWQLCSLVGNGPKELIHFSHNHQSHSIELLSDGLNRLKNGLQKAGLRADFFSWPPKHDPNRRPYRGFCALDVDDAAIFFGRDVEILRGLDTLRGMRDGIDKKLFVILGASGAGKSSFLRAGLIPRLKRDDRHFYVLPVIRPETNPLSGNYGLASSIHKAILELKLPPQNRGNIIRDLKNGPESLILILRAIQVAARDRLISQTPEAPAPTIILPIDQTEELFTDDSDIFERNQFLNLLGAILRKESSISVLTTIAIFTIRSDKYEPLQTAVELSGLNSYVFDELKPMPHDRFREVILGPAKRTSIQGNKLDVKPDLVNRLLEDCNQGADTLPLLSLTLASLLEEFGSDGDLRLDEYETMGGISGIVKRQTESVLSTTPEMRTQQLNYLQAAFIPWLVAIDPQSNLPMRRLANIDDLPIESLPLIKQLAEKRLLSIDQREGVRIVEVAHEALLRHWDILINWLDPQKENLKELETLQRFTQTWAKNNKKSDWLISGELLQKMELLLSIYSRFALQNENCNEFIKSSREAENDRVEKDRQQKEAELKAAYQLADYQLKQTEIEREAKLAAEKFSTQISRKNIVLKRLSLFVAILAILAVFFADFAYKKQLQSETELKHAVSLKLLSQSQAILNGNRPGSAVLAVLQLISASQLYPESESVQEKLLQTIRDNGALFRITDTPGVKDLAVSPVGQSFITGYHDSTLQQWDITTGSAIGSPIPYTKQLLSKIRYKPDGSKILTIGFKGMGIVGAHETVDTHERFIQHDKRILDSIFSASMETLYSVDNKGTRRTYDGYGNENISNQCRLFDKEYLLTDALISGDTKRIAAESLDFGLILSDLDTCKLIKQIFNVSLNLGSSSLSFSADNQFLAYPKENFSIGLLDASSGRLIEGRPFSGHTDRVTQIAFSEDNRKIVSLSDDHTLRIWDAATGTVIGEPIEGPIKNGENYFTDVAFAPDGSTIIAVGDGDVSFWKANGDVSVGIALKGHKLSVNAIVFSPDGDLMASGSNDATIRLWNVKTMKQIGKPLQGHKGAVYSLAFSPDGRHIVSGGEDATLRLWDVRTQELIGSAVKAHKDSIINSVAYSPDGKIIASGSGTILNEEDDDTIRLWDAKTLESIGNALNFSAGKTSNISFTRDSRRIVFSDESGDIRVWDLIDKREVVKIGKSDGIDTPPGSALSSDEQLVFSINYVDNSLITWDVKSGNPIKTEKLEDQGVSVHAAAFSPDLKYVAYSDLKNANLHISYVNSGKSILPGGLTGHSSDNSGGTIRSVSFSPDGSFIATGGDDGDIRIWPSPSNLRNQLCKKLLRNMSPKEWQEWVSPDIDYIEQCPGL